MTARNLQDQVKKRGLPWSAAKGFDTFTPIGCVYGSFVLVVKTPTHGLGIVNLSPSRQFKTPTTSIWHSRYAVK